MSKESKKAAIAALKENPSITVDELIKVIMEETKVSNAVAIKDANAAIEEMKGDDGEVGEDPKAQDPKAPEDSPKPNETVKEEQPQAETPTKEDDLFAYEVKDNEKDRVILSVEVVRFSPHTNRRLSKPRILRLVPRAWKMFIKEHKTQGLTIQRIHNLPEGAAKFDLEAYHAKEKAEAEALDAKFI